MQDFFHQQFNLELESASHRVLPLLPANHLLRSEMIVNNVAPLVQHVKTGNKSLGRLSSFAMKLHLGLLMKSSINLLGDVKKFTQTTRLSKVVRLVTCACCKRYKKVELKAICNSSMPLISKVFFHGCWMGQATYMRSLNPG